MILLLLKTAPKHMALCIYGHSVGTFGDVAAWSFCQDKIITTAGEGGMVNHIDLTYGM